MLLYSESGAKSIIIEGETVAELRQLWIDACLQFDELRAKQTLAQAFALFPTQLVCFELLQKGLVEVGAGWYEGRISVQQEHFASALAMRRLNTLVSAAPAPTRQLALGRGPPPTGQDR